jgi:lysophospholipase L1-like esterase
MPAFRLPLRVRRPRVRRALGALLAAPLLLTGLVACSGDDAGADEPSASRSPSGSHSASPSPAGRAKYDRYVALGDSYTAAPLVPQTDTGDACLRSTGNYPSLVAAALPVAELVDVSCSGADSASMTGVQRAGSQSEPPQFDALTRSTDLVTLGIGGNDFGLFATLVGVCTQLRSQDPTGSPCTDRYAGGGSAELDSQLGEIRRHVAAIVAGIRDRAPQARVLVVGYPQIVPDHGTCPRLLPLADGDYPFARRIATGLVQAVRAGARGAGYVDVFAATRGHDICADDPWINGHETDAARALAFHPFAAEQQAVAELIVKRLR